MAIWSYDHPDKDPPRIRVALQLNSCLYCKAVLTIHHHERGDLPAPSVHDISPEAEALVRVCRLCGWWVAREDIWFLNFQGAAESQLVRGSYGTLKQLDFSDLSVPLREIRAYLRAKYEARFEIDPYRFEQVVASVFADLGYAARVTGSRQGDEGIDVMLDGPGDSLIGVQVKRYRGKIKVEQLRALVGALVLKGLTRGVFVTTSEFQSGAERVVNVAKLRGIRLELVDAGRFFDALGLAQRESFEPTSLLVNRDSLVEVEHKWLR